MDTNKIKDFYENVSKSGKLFRDYIIEMQNPVQKILTDEILGVEYEICDDYDFLENKVVVMNFKMTVKNDLLYEVLSSMEQQHRDIIYLSLCEDLSDREIGERLKLSRAKVQRVKQKLKNEIYNVMTGGAKDGNKG